MQQIRNVKVISAGRPWNGSWEIDAATGDLIVSSAYGSEKARPGKDPKATAERLMRKIVAARG